MRILFAGTPEFALPSLDALAASAHELIGVFTQPDRPAGRGRKLTASPVKARAMSLGLPVFQPETLRDETVQKQIAELQPDLMVVVAYGLLLPQSVLDIPPKGCINVHASLLPRWRGAAPIARAIQAGDAETGVTIMRMARGLDTGDMLLSRDCEITAEATAGSLHDQISDMGANLLVTALAGIQNESLTASPQNSEHATYAKLLDKAEAEVDWSQPAQTIARNIRAFNPWPVAYTGLGDQRLRLWRARLISGGTGKPGEIVAVGDQGIDVATGQGSLRITELQWPGKKAIPAADAARRRNLVGQRFG